MMRLIDPTVGVDRDREAVSITIAATVMPVKTEDCDAALLWAERAEAALDNFISEVRLIQSRMDSARSSVGLGREVLQMEELRVRAGDRNAAVSAGLQLADELGISSAHLAEPIREGDGWWTIAVLTVPRDVQPGAGSAYGMEVERG